MTQRSLARVLLAILGVAVVFLFLYLFRVESSNNPSLGNIKVTYRWGRPRVLSIDTNRDGQVDGRYVLAPRTVVVTPHSQWVEAWESSTCDGSFDLHFYKNAESVLVLETDFDGDGEFRAEGQGEEVEEYLVSLSRPENCGGASAL